MGRLAAVYAQAVSAHRQAHEHLEAARQTLDRPAAASGPAGVADPAEIVDELRRVGSMLAGGVGATGVDLLPVPLGTAITSAGDFPVLVPLGAGRHLAIDADAREPRVAALLRRLVVGLLAAAPPGSARVWTVDSSTLGATFRPLQPLVEAGALGPPATTDEEIAAVLDAAEQHARATLPAGAAPAVAEELFVLVATSAERELARLAALTHAGPAAGICVIVAGYPPRSIGITPPSLAATSIRLDGQQARVGDPPDFPLSSDGTGLAAPVRLTHDPPAAEVTVLATRLAQVARRDNAPDFDGLLPHRRWTESSVDGLRTVVGRAGRRQVELAFDDATPHWLIGGRTGAGKTVFLLNVLYGLSIRYSPAELRLYLLDFKEGVSFTEFVPTPHDPSWVPHARAVGIESDREYGVAVLRELRRELNRRANALKRYGVTKLADLRRAADASLPRIVAVIDEFQVLFAGNDALAREAVTLLEDLARKGRSYGVHLVLASQSLSGIEALYGRSDSIFGQFPLRVALPGGSGVLDPLNDAAAALAIGSAVVNDTGGSAAGNTVIRFPNAHAEAARVAELRNELWRARPPGALPPAVFKGYEPARLDDDPTFRSLKPGGRRPLALVGRVVDVDLSTAYFPFDTAPGRHLAVVGTAPLGADVLHAATVSLARQYPSGSARFLLAALVAEAEEVAERTRDMLVAIGHPVTELNAAGLRDEIGKLAEPSATPPMPGTFLVGFGMDGAAATLGRRDPETFRSGLDDLQALLRQGPAHGLHLLGWWRGLRRLADDLGGTHNRDDIACLVALNVPGDELSAYLGMPDLAYTPRPNRALLVDRHDQRTRLIVPFSGPGRELDEELG